MVYAFESRANRLNLELVFTKDGKETRKEVQFEGHEFVTDKDEVGEQLKKHPLFRGEEESESGFWFLPEGIIAGANKKKRQGRYKVQRGPAGTNRE